MKKEILIITETFDNQVSPANYELINFAKMFLKNIDSKIIIIIPGQNIQKAAKKIAKTTGIDVIALENDNLKYNNADILSKGINDICDKLNPSYICLLDSIYSNQVASYLSVTRKASCITGIESCEFKNNQLIFQRRLFNGKLIMDIKSSNKKNILTILPGAFSAMGNDNTDMKPGNCELKKIEYDTVNIIHSGIIKNIDTDVNLNHADTIISIGRGLGDKENMEIINEFSKIFSKSAIGASKIVCDYGWLPYAHQVGTTGKTVSPKLYIACGISGSQQHIAGMKNSQWKIAINIDPQAAIFYISNFCIVEDLNTFIPVILKKYDELFEK